MGNSINRWFSRRPYAVSSLVFVVMAILGWRVLGWGEQEFGFMLLLYFIVTLGVRLDEISRSIGGNTANPHGQAGDPDTLIAHLKEIEELLRRIDAKLQGPGRGEE
jgi:hypothetical protein